LIETIKNSESISLLNEKPVKRIKIGDMFLQGVTQGANRKHLSSQLVTLRVSGNCGVSPVGNQKKARVDCPGLFVAVTGQNYTLVKIKRFLTEGRKATLIIHSSSANRLHYSLFIIH